MKLYNESVIDSIVDIYRTSPINPNYPHGMDCEICRKAGIECYTDSGDGYECNTGYVKYLEQKLAERKQSTVSAISLDKLEQAREEIENLNLNDYGDNLYQLQAKCSEILSKLIESEDKTWKKYL